MADQDRRRKEREAQANPTPESKAHLLIEDLRAGRISQDMLDLLAFVDNKGARVATSTTTRCRAGAHSEVCLISWGHHCPWMLDWADGRDYAMVLMELAEAAGLNVQRMVVQIYHSILSDCYQIARDATTFLSAAQLSQVERRIEQTARWLTGNGRGARPEHHPLGGTYLPDWADIGLLTWTKRGWERAFPDLIQEMAQETGQPIIKELMQQYMVNHILPEYKQP